MTELEKFELVKQAETTDELKEAIKLIGSETGFIQGRTKLFSVDSQLRGVDLIITSTSCMNALTRSYGIRQQMLYLLFYNRISINANTTTDTQKQNSDSSIGDTIETKN